MTTLASLLNECTLLGLDCSAFFFFLFDSEEGFVVQLRSVLV